MDVLIVFLIFFAVFMPAAVLCKHLFNWGGTNCPYCRKRLTPFDSLAPEARERILAYFEGCERRQPDTEDVFLCAACNVICDDFIKDRLLSLDPSHPAARQSSPRIAFCKVCSQPLPQSHPAAGAIACIGCGTAYGWREHDGSGFRFLTPLESPRQSQA